MRSGTRLIVRLCRQYIAEGCSHHQKTSQDKHKIKFYNGIKPEQNDMLEATCNKEVFGMPTVVHLDIATDDPQKAKTFYEQLFGWRFQAPPGMTDYYLFETEDLDGQKGVGGGLGKRGDPSQKISAYIGVENVDEYSKKVATLGGKVVTPKMTVPGWGYLAICLDTEGNTFGLWQEDPNAH